jgi:hypothetical protein
MISSYRVVSYWRTDCTQKDRYQIDGQTDRQTEGQISDRWTDRQTDITSPSESQAQVGLSSGSPKFKTVLKTLGTDTYFFCTLHKDVGIAEVQLHSFFYFVTRWRLKINITPGRFTLVTSHGTHWTVSCVGRRDSVGLLQGRKYFVPTWILIPVPLSGILMSIPSAQPRCCL